MPLRAAHISPYIRAFWTAHFYSFSTTKLVAQCATVCSAERYPVDAADSAAKRRAHRSALHPTICSTIYPAHDDTFRSAIRTAFQPPQF
jgi:hypothetical protein